MRWEPKQVAAFQRGEDAAIARLYRDHARQVLGWVIRLGGPRLDAEDVAHDVFTTAIRRCADFRGDAAPSTWLFAITRRVVANARRRAAFRRFLGLESAPEPIDDAPGADELVGRMRRRRRVQELLETLSDAHREILVLVDLEDRACPQAAEMLGIPLGTAYSRLHHARRAFSVAAADAGFDAHDAMDGVPAREAR
jgi:RNA polymerase sigma-70 factor (ECF subfamily)